MPKFHHHKAFESAMVGKFEIASSKYLGIIFIKIIGYIHHWETAGLQYQFYQVRWSRVLTVLGKQHYSRHLLQGEK